MLLTFVRHGPTIMNEDGRLRGWMDPPLSEAGLVQARNLAVPMLGTLYSSDLRRAMQTAEVLGTPAVAFALRPWDVGVFAGQPATDAHVALKQYLVRPNLRVPFGEPFAEFADRFLRFVHSIVEPSTLVTHFRNVKLMMAHRDSGYDGYSIDSLLKDDLLTLSVLQFEVPR